LSSIVIALAIFVPPAFSQPIVFQENFDSPLVGWSQTVCIRNDPPQQSCIIGTSDRLVDPLGPPIPGVMPSSPPNWGYVQITDFISDNLPGSAEVRYKKSFNVVVEGDYPISAVLGTKDCKGCNILTQLYVDSDVNPAPVFQNIGVNTNINTGDHPYKFSHEGTIHLVSGTHYVELGMYTDVAFNGPFRASFDDIKIGVDPDVDGDGYSPVLDCNDNNNIVFPGAPELNDGLDNNCNGIVDEGFSSPGSYYDTTDKVVKLCSPGKYQPNPNQTSCIDADPGHYATGPGATQQLECQSGSFSNLSGAAQCTLAPAGRFVDTTAATEPTLCPPGTYQPNTGQTSCIDADPGHYATGPAATQQLECPLGTTSTVGAIECTPIQPTDVILSANKDSFLRKSAKNTNEGANTILMIQKAGNKRTLLSFDLSGYENQQISSATLRLYVTYNGGNWGKQNDRMIEIHKLLSDWTEGNGANFIPKNLDEDDEPDKNKGSGSGVTWACSTDSNIANKKSDCNSKRVGANFASGIIDSEIITGTTLDQWIEFDVTDSVKSILDGTSPNYGWLIKKSNEQNSGRIAFASRENMDISIHPQLVLQFG
jgi:hypothetical protein